MRWLKHAFAVEPPGPAVPTEAQRAVVDRVLVAVLERRMTAPARLALEMSRPLNYLAAQSMHFFAPLVTSLVGPKEYDQFVAFLEQRGSIDYLCRRMGELESSRPAPAEDGQLGDRAP